MHQVLVSSILMQSKLIMSVLTKVRSRVQSGCAVHGSKSFLGGHSALCVTETHYYAIEEVRRDPVGEVL